MSFALLFPRIELPNEASFELCPGHLMRRANADEVKAIQEFVGSGMGFAEQFLGHFEYEAKTEGANVVHSRGAPETWGYSVVSFEGAPSELRILQYALDLLPGQFVLGLTLADGGKSSWHLTNAVQKLRNHYETGHLVRPASFGAPMAASVRRSFDKLKNLETIKGALAPFHRFGQLKDLPLISDSHVLALFAVVEMMVTHDPKGTHDSLTHQVSTKMPLLSKHFMPPTLDKPYEGTDTRKIWKALYEWRSRLAHGATANFADKELKILKNEGDAHTFLDMNVRLLLAAWLDHYKWIPDLKEC